MPRRKASNNTPAKQARTSRNSKSKKGAVVSKTSSKQTAAKKTNTSKATKKTPQKVAKKSEKLPTKTKAATSKNSKANAPGPKLNKPPRFSWAVDNVLGGMGRPTKPGHLNFLIHHKVKYLITLTINMPTAVKDFGVYPNSSLVWVHIPIQDETPPSVEQIQKFVDTVDKAKKEKVAAAAHCAWGRGRTGTMLACYLLSQDDKLTAEDAVTKIRELRPGSIDTDKQKQAVVSYYEFLKKR